MLIATVTVPRLREAQENGFESGPRSEKFPGDLYAGRAATNCPEGPKTRPSSLSPNAISGRELCEVRFVARPGQSAMGGARRCCEPSTKASAREFS